MTTTKRSDEVVSVARERTALFLYVVLLVLPALVLGALLTHRLWREHRAQLDDLPARCEESARRVASGVAYRLESLLDAESRRPFFHYQEEFLDPDTKGGVALGPSPLVSEPRPEGVLAWYSYDDIGMHGKDGASAFFGLHPVLDEAQVRRIVKRDLSGDESSRRTILQYTVETGVEGEVDVLVYTYRVLGVNLHRGDERECYSIPQVAAEFIDLLGDVRVSLPDVRWVRDTAGESRLIAERAVYLPGEPVSDAPACIQHLERSYYFIQGVVLDPVWLFENLPQELAAQELLDPLQRLVRPSEVASLPEDAIVRSANFFDGLPYSVMGEGAHELGRIEVVTDRSALQRRFRAQLGWLAGVATILTLSMGIGVRLLVGRIQGAREEAQRTRNFVAAVTHELRTPVASVKLYSEMLADGWIQDEARRQEYLQRIVRETDRLALLVDRVLLRRKLQDQPPAPTPGDLRQEILAQRSDLELVGGETAHDLMFDLAPDLPPVLLVPDGVHVVLTNLVENARKYAPVPKDDPNAEPIVVRTRREGRGQVVLEVLDRGPGVPESERRRIFEAFYRPGDERTRATTGTGLGLHLVALQARAMRGRVDVLTREGGGSIFRFTFRAARAPRR